LLLSRAGRKKDELPEAPTQFLLKVLLLLLLLL
jgi:hypothetical protein